MARIIVFIFLAGVAVGIAGTILVPRVAGPYLPGVFGSKEASVEGRVAGKLRDADRLLVTVESDRGSVLATFTERVPEIDLLVATGDTIVISMPEYSPFVENPPIERVAKSEHLPPPADVDIELPTSADDSLESENAVAEAGPEPPEPEVGDPGPAISPPPVRESPSPEADPDPPTVPE